MGPCFCEQISELMPFQEDSPLAFAKYKGADQKMMSYSSNF
jgi:hypothetical protein